MSIAHLSTYRNRTPINRTRRNSKGHPLCYFIRDICIDPAVVLAPMEGVTNIVFRRLMKKIGGMGLTYTEFIPSRGIIENSKQYLKMADFDKEEYPIAIQIYGNQPKMMAMAAQIVQDKGADIVDINMGCPSKKVCSNSGGSALMKDPTLAIEIVRAVKQVLQVPLTVKMRSGFDSSDRNAPDLAYMCQEEGTEGITIHWRTREDRYGGTRQIDKIAETKEKLHIPVIANGDIVDVKSAIKMVTETGCDGVMIGRGSMKNPWSLLEIANAFQGKPPPNITSDDKKNLLLSFLDTHFEKLRVEKAALGKFKGIAKHFCTGLENGDHLRYRLLRAQNMDDVHIIVEEFFTYESTQYFHNNREL
jgi:tRNA-dihydrouridine synthase B